jgi:hypothetical protein
MRPGLLSILFDRLAELIDAIRVGKDLSFDAALTSSRPAEFSGGQFEKEAGHPPGSSEIGDRRKSMRIAQIAPFMSRFAQSFMVERSASSRI